MSEKAPVALHLWFILFDALGRYFADQISKYILFNEPLCVSLQMSLNMMTSSNRLIFRIAGPL